MKFLVSVGEPSGDLLAAGLVQALRKEFPSAEFAGVVGPQLISAGVQPLFRIEDLTSFGFVGALAKIPGHLSLEAQLAEYCQSEGVSVAILVDYAGFHLRLGETLRLCGTKVVQYIAPKLWAWGSGRAEKLNRACDAVLGIFPHEQAFFHRLGVAIDYVGCPHLARVEAAVFDRRNFGYSPDDIVVALLPGSRAGEVRRLLRPFLEAARLVKSNRPACKFIMPVPPGVAHLVRRIIDECGDSGLDLQVVSGSSLQVMKISQVALLASGTAVLECGLAGTPMAVAYRLSGIGYRVAKMLVKINQYSLVNIILGRPLLREFIQYFSPDDLAKEVLDLIDEDSDRRREVLAGLGELRRSLSEQPPKTATKVIRDLVEKR